MLTFANFSVSERVAELESTTKILEEQLEEQSSDAENAISQWQESYTVLEVRSSELETQLETLTKEKEERSSVELVVEELRSENERLERELRERDEALAAAGEDHNQDADAVHEWEGELLEGCAWFSRSVDMIVVADTDVTRFSVTEQVAELELTNKSLEDQLEEQSSDADNAISQWQESYTALEQRSSELERQLETLTKEKEELLNVKRSDSALAVEELRSENERLERELRERDEALAAAGEDHNQDADVVHEWEGELLQGCAWFSRSVDMIVVADTDVTRFSVTEQVAELESANKSLEDQLEEQSSDADNAISQWQESYTALEERSSELERQLETLTKEKEELLMNVERSSSALGQSATFEELQSEKERLEQELRERDQALVASRQDLNQDADAVHVWEGELPGVCE
jgi:chromosome segregation ATPase